MFSIVASDHLAKMKSRMLLVHDKCFEQFVDGVLWWYQDEVTYPAVPFFDGIPKVNIPNVFNLTEYPNPSSEIVIRLFVDSEIHHMMEQYQYDYETAKEKSIHFYNNTKPERDMFILSDIEQILDGHNMFYCYQDDAHATCLYKNPYVKEVW